MEQVGQSNPLFRQIGAALLLCSALLAFAPWLDRHADSSLSVAITSTLALFASVRGVDAIVSSLEGTELALSPVGIGVTFAPGELLEPIDDLIEQLADVLLWVLTLMGVERLSIGLLGSVWVRSLSASVLVAAALVLWLRPHWKWPGYARKFVVVLVLLRLALPLVAISSELVAQHIVDTRTAAAEAALVTMSQQIRTEQSQTNAANSAGTDTTGNPSLLERLETATRNFSENLQIQARMQRLSNRLDEGVNHAVDLLALVILRALLFPALFLLSGWFALRVVED